MCTEIYSAVIDILRDVIADVHTQPFNGLLSGTTSLTY